MPIRAGLSSVRNKSQTPPPKQVPGKAEKPSPPTNNKPRFERKIEMRTALCGHDAELEILIGQPADHAKTREERVTQRKCPTCRAVDEAAKKEEDAKRKANAPPKSQKTIERLPDGSIFHVIYDAKREMWDGVLTVNGRQFAAGYSAVFKLLRALDTMYRRSVKKDMDADSNNQMQAAV
jgi:hypothetical protein